MANPSSRPPRFLPPDPRVTQPYLLTPKMALRVAILGAVALVAFGILFLRLWSLQVLAATKYRSEAQNNQVRTISLEAPRGPILDRNGNVLVTNTVSNAVVVWPADLPTGQRRTDELWQLGKVLETTAGKIGATLKAHEKDGPIATTPVTLQVGITPDQAAYIYEHAAQFAGVEIKPTYLRYYNSEGLLAQTLGYVGRIDPQQYKALRKIKVHGLQKYQPDDRIGQAGVEAAYDEYLHGTPGTAQVTVDSTGRPTSRLEQTLQPQAGDSVRLTIDLPLQRMAEQALVDGINLAHKNPLDGWAANGGAIVALDPNTGAILAMASNPTYAPRAWVYPTANGLKPLLDQKAAEAANYPILNRVTDVTYPPGSTWKPITALAALEENVASAYNPLLCSPTYTVKTIYGAPQTFKNWNPNISQYMTMPTALAQSCDTYFYQLGFDFYNLPTNRGQPLQRWAERFGFGKYTGVDVGPESDGLVPTIAWRHKTFTRKTDPRGWQIDRLWKPGDSIQLAIGQKDIAVTPLQLARFYALLANGGKLVTPHVVQDVELPSPGGKGVPTVLRSFQPPAPQSVGLDPSDLQVVRDGLFQGTHDPNGTSYGTFGHFPIPIAGKTGTAEKVVTLPGQKTSQVLNQSLWCGWGPYDAPTIVVCAVIENGGHGAAAAAPAAAEVLAKFFHIKANAGAGPNTD